MAPAQAGIDPAIQAAKRNRPVADRTGHCAQDFPVTHRPARDLLACYHIYQFCDFLSTVALLARCAGQALTSSPPV